jgi:hypothetical protein
MIEINPKENTTLTFEVDVSGTVATPKPRLLVQLGEGVNLAFEGVVNDGSVDVDIAELLKLTESNEFEAKLEVIVEDCIFVPWEEKIVINKPTIVEAAAVTEKVEKPKVTAKTKVTSTKDVALPTDPIKESKGKIIGEAPEVDNKSKKSIDELFKDELK